MQIGIVGLGRMGANIARRLQRNGHECIVHDVNPAVVQELTAEGFKGVNSLSELAARLQPPRQVWAMLPSGKVTESAIDELSDLLARGDVIIDGGNTFYQDDIRRAASLSKKGIGYIDVGTSGGVWGLEKGYCLMIGGQTNDVKRLDPIFSTLAPGQTDVSRTAGRTGSHDKAELGYIHCGPHGAGHFVKMIHNGIEYGIMQAYAEGFDILHSVNNPNVPAERRYQFDLPQIAEVWRHGSVVSSWLLDLTASALFENESLSNFSGVVQDSGEGRWTVDAAVELAVPAEVLTAALFARFRSRQSHTFAERMLSAMRFKFGGHVEPKHGS